jgi:hypothetical protein
MFGFFNSTKMGKSKSIFEKIEHLKCADYTGIRSGPSGLRLWRPHADCLLYYRPAGGRPHPAPSGKRALQSEGSFRIPRCAGRTHPLLLILLMVPLVYLLRLIPRRQSEFQMDRASNPDVGGRLVASKDREKLPPQPNPALRCYQGITVDFLDRCTRPSSA